MLSKEIRINEDNSRLVYFDGRDKIDNVDEPDDEIFRRRIQRTRNFSQIFNGAEYKDSGILPLNCRYNNRVSKIHNIIITEDQPRIRTLFFDLDFERMIEQLSITGKLEEYGYKDFLEKNKRPYKLRISLPYVVYIFNIIDNMIGNVQVFFRLSPISSIFDYLLIPNLCNISNNYGVCIGNNNVNKKLSIPDKINNYIDLFWSTPFNNDYNEHCLKYKYVSEVSNFLTWSYHTKQNPMFIFNVPWLKTKDNIQQRINSFVDNYDNSSGGTDNLYYKILSVFEDTRTEYKKEEEIFKNSGDSLHFDTKLVSVGDMFKFKNGSNVYIKEFAYHNGNDKKYVEIEFENEKSSWYKITKKFGDFILNQLTESEHILESTIKADGTIVKVGDILCFKNGTFKKVDKIRIAIDNNIEILAGENYYLAKNLEASVFDGTDIEFSGVKVTKGETYSLYPKEFAFSNFVQRNITFKQCITPSNSMYLDFERGEESYRFKLTDQQYYQIVKEEELEKLPAVYRIDSRLINTYDGYIDKDGIIILDYNRYDRITKDDLIKNCLIENSLIIKGKDLDINFSINDKVVIADWKIPVNMLKIKTITNFIVDGNYLFIEVTDSNENKELIPYIDIRDNIINIGDVRKISTSYENVRSGMKIRANVKGITNFPKKDTNIIIGFITDTGEDQPLVLCSNCCTLWVEDLINNFTIIPKSSKAWTKSNHAPIDISKIKPQVGDLFICNRSSPQVNIISCNKYFNKLRSPVRSITSYRSTYLDCYTYHNNDFNYFSGILNPRKATSSPNGRICNGIPNFHNVIKPLVDNFSNSYLRFDIGGNDV